MKPLDKKKYLSSRGEFSILYLRHDSGFMHQIARVI